MKHLTSTNKTYNPEGEGTEATAVEGFLDLYLDRRPAELTGVVEVVWNQEQ